MAAPPDRVRRPTVRATLAWTSLPLALWALYLWTGHGIGSPDNLALRYLPLSLLGDGDFDLNEFAFLFAEPLVLYPLVYHAGRWLPFPPVAPALLALPFYLPPVLAGLEAASPWVPVVEKAAAAGMATLSALCIAAALVRVVKVHAALLATALYALGTSTFSVSSQTLWPVGAAQLLLAAGLYALIRGRTEPSWTAVAALPLSWAALCRPSSALIWGFIALYVLGHRRRQGVAFALLTLPAVVFQLAYNAVYFADPFLPPGYVSSGGHVLARLDNFNASLMQGLAGLLVSPAVGFFVHSPIFLAAPIGIARRWRDPLTPYLTLGAAAVVLVQSKLNMWWGGGFLGARYVIEIAPILTYFLGVGLLGWQGWGRRAVLVVLAAWSLHANAVMASAFDGSWDHGAELWSWSNNPIVYYSRQSWRRWSDRLGYMVGRLAQGFSPLPDSRQREALAAALEVGELPAQAPTNAFFDVVVRAQNTGLARWRRAAPGGLGTVHVGWRWRRQGGAPDAELEGRGPPLTADLLPGQQTAFPVRIWAPPDPGRYLLELGMVSERVAWFGGADGELLQAPVEITGEPLCQFERALAALAERTAPPLRLQWVADRTVLRADEVFAARLNIANPGPPRVLYPLIVLRWPDGVSRFWDLDRGRFQPLCPGWIRPRWALFLDQGYRAVDYPILSLVLKDLPAGPYTLSLVYLQLGGSAVWSAGHAALTFERLP
jgi:hypothetical protein